MDFGSRRQPGPRRPTPITMIRHISAYRGALGLALLAAFLIVWMNLAVGIIGEPYDLANLMYVAVLAIGATGAIAGRCRPGAMARAMFAMAGAQVLVTAITLIGQLGIPPAKPMWVFVVNSLFCVLFVGSGLLFFRAHAGETENLDAI